MMNKRIHSIVSSFFTLLVLSLLFLSGPAAAVTVSLTAPGSIAKGDDVTFTVTVDVNDPDTYLPVKYTNLILNGPNGFSKTCKVNLDGTSDCSDVDVTITNNLGSGTGTGYGYDNAIGYGYNFGNNFGYGYSGAYGSITYTITWHTSSALINGIYTAEAGLYAEGTDSHTYLSSIDSFTVGNPTVNTGNEPNTGPGFRGEPYPLEEETVEVVEEVVPAIVEEVPKTEEGIVSTTGATTAGNEITGAVVGTSGLSSGVKKGAIAVTAAGGIVLLSYLGYIGKFLRLFRRF